MQIVGNTTSGCFSPVLNKSLVFAYVPVSASTPGSRLLVEVMGKKLEALVLANPPVLTQPIREKMEAKLEQKKNKTLNH